MELFSRIGAVAAPLLIYLIFILSSLAIGALGLVGGYAIGAGLIDAPTGMLVARVLLLVVFAFILLVPLGRSMHGASTQEPRFLLLPVTRRALHDVEVAAGLADPWIAFVLPGFLLLPLGLILANHVPAAFTILALGVAFVGVLACLASLLTFLVQWLLRDRRRAEIATILFVLLLSSFGILSVLFSDTVEQKVREERRERRLTTEEIDALLPSWTLLIPSEIYARSARRAIEDDARAGLPGAAGLLLEAVILYALSSLVHRRVMASPELTGARRRAALDRPRRIRIPGLSDGATAVAQVHFRSALRTVRGKLAVYPSGLMVVVFGMVIGRVIDEIPIGGMLASQGHVLLSLGILFSLLSLQPILLNQFATDRAGLTALFLAPISEWDIVRGKAIAGAALLGISTSLCLIATLLFFPGGSIFNWLSALLGGVSIYILLAPAAALLSAILPRSADLSKIGSQGNPHTAAALIGTLLMLLLSVPPGLIVMIGSGLLGMSWVAFALMVLWTLLVLGIATPLLKAASRAMRNRQENLNLVAMGN